MLLFSEPEDMAERLFGITEKLLIFADNDSEKRNYGKLPTEYEACKYACRDFLKYRNYNREENKCIKSLLLLQKQDAIIWVRWK